MHALAVHGLIVEFDSQPWLFANRDETIYRFYAWLGQLGPYRCFLNTVLKDEGAPSGGQPMKACLDLGNLLWLLP